jgi:hypothetical protein
MVPELADRIAGLAEKRGVTVKALLQGLEEEKNHPVRGEVCAFHPRRPAW